MSFVQPEFVAFFTVVLALYWSLGRRLQNVLLGLASLVFYGWVHPWFVGLLLWSALTDYASALGMRRWPRYRRALLGVSLVGNLGLLGFFKYADFFVGSVAAALGALGLRTDLHTLGILLPVGISFFTFQTLSYTIDVYRGRLEPRSDLIDYLLFVSFFPQLVAGPIERAARMLPQIERPRTFDRERFASGLGLALWGGFKKVVIADSLALAVGATFGQDRPSSAMIWVASAAFTVQLFADFSGYTDLARGTARMLGFDLMENFHEPFLATSPSEWWGRWHISFSSWMRDYVFQPLALSPWFRRLSWPGASSRSHAHRAMFVTMLVGGLWHGASWNFVLWGGMFGALQLVWVTVGPRLPAAAKEWRDGRRALVLLMFGVTTLSSMLFREPDLHRIAMYLTERPFGGSPTQWMAAGVTGGMALSGAAPMVGMWWYRTRIRPTLDPRWRLPLTTTGWCLAAWALFTFGHGAQTAFVYFSF